MHLIGDAIKQKFIIVIYFMHLMLKVFGYLLFSLTQNKHVGGLNGVFT